MIPKRSSRLSEFVMRQRKNLALGPIALNRIMV